MTVRTRLPVQLVQNTGGGDDCWLAAIVHDRHPTLELEKEFCLISVEESENSISTLMEDFLIDHARCVGCLRPLPKLARPCCCGFEGVFNFQNINNLILNGAALKEEFFNLWRRDNKSKSSRYRRKYDSEIPRGLSDELLEVQRYRCWYCCSEINRGKSSPNQAQLDHFEPHEGNKVNNFVMACKSCNGKKGDKDGYAFMRKMASLLSAGEKQEAKNLRARVRRFRNSKRAKKWVEHFDSLDH